MTHKIEFNIEQVVYLKTDLEQRPRMVTGITLRPHNSVTYELAEGNNSSWHYGIEITKEKSINTVGYK